jgi:hypothetical protein
MRVWDEPVRRDGRGRIDDWRAAIATGLLLGGLLIGMQACGSDDDAPSAPPEPRVIDVSTNSDNISIRRIFMEDSDLPLTCVIYSDVGGGGINENYGLGAGIDCDWVGYHSDWLDQQ